MSKRDKEQRVPDRRVRCKPSNRGNARNLVFKKWAVSESLRPDVADEDVVAADRVALDAARDLETAQTAHAHSPHSSQALLERCLRRYLRAASDADRTAS